MSFSWHKDRDQGAGSHGGAGPSAAGNYKELPIGGGEYALVRQAVRGRESEEAPV